MTEQKDVIQGRVKWFNSKRGFGFVTYKINGEDEDAFIHHSDIMTGTDVYKELFENEVIQFKLDRQEDKYYAREITGKNGEDLLCEKNENKKPKNNHIQKRGRKRNTESFSPSYELPDMRVLVCAGKERYTHKCTGRDVILVPDLFSKDENLNIYNSLLQEIKNTGKEENGLWKLWHGDTHFIADDKLGWKESCPTFLGVLEKIKDYFQMDIKATRLNWYKNPSEWKPFHHDAAAVKKDKARTQNFTVGISFGIERDIAFEHAKTRSVVTFPLQNGCTYAFSKDVNVIWRHGIPQITSDNNQEGGRISIIAWGWNKQE